jgi:hypothetical protein
LNLIRSQVSIASALTTRPNFLVIGAAKSGTTALWHYLRRHPQIYMSPREHTRFFAFKDEEPRFNGPGPKNPSRPYAVADANSYHALFPGATDETAVGEASHSYLYWPEAPARIRQYAPGMKLIAVLRDPAERAYSHYTQMIRDGREPIDDFVHALEAEEARIRGNWWPDFHYTRMGHYHTQLQRYFELFERDQIRIYLYEDFVLDPTRVLRDMFMFLSVDSTFVPEATVKYNASGVPRNRVVHAALQQLRLIKPAAERSLPESWERFLSRVGAKLHNRNLSKSQLSSDIRREVIENHFREDISNLQVLIRRDLSAWLR